MRAPGTNAKSDSRSKHVNPLQRGSACLCCRKRKMKCDGTKPVCRQCVRTNRADDCEYDDGKLKSRTQVLQEKIVDLEEKIKELETSPDDVPISRTGSPTSSLLYLTGFEASSSTYSPQQVFSSTASGSPLSPWGLGDDTSSSSPSISSTPWLSSSFSVTPGLQFDANGIALDYFTGPDVATPLNILQHTKGSLRWSGYEELNARDRDMLIDIFLPHAKQCGFEIHVERLRASLDGSVLEGSAPHPALMNAIYLLGCHFSHSPALSAHESQFLTRALSGISTALEHSDRLVNVVQASGLLAVYFFSKARLLEGYYHSSSAARLAIALGLHQIRTPIWQPQETFAAASTAWNGSSGSFVPLAPPKHQVELGERILAFWQVFVVDRCWSVATGLPSSLPDDDHPQLQISTVWPRSIYDYEADIVLDVDYTSLEALDDTQSSAYTLSTNVQSLHAKAVAFFERASRIASGLAQGEPDQWDKFRQMDLTLSKFIALLPGYIIQPQPVTDDVLNIVDELQLYTGTTLSQSAPVIRVDVQLALVHTFAYVSVIQLLQRLLQEQKLDLQTKCLAAARSITVIVRQLVESDYQYLDPIIGTCWMCASEIFVQQRSWTNDALNVGAQYSPEEEINTIVRALKQLSFTSPVALYQAEKIEQSRVIGA